MKKLLYFLLIFMASSVFTPASIHAQVDSSCQIFGTGNVLTIPTGTIKRFYTKYIPGAIYGWSVMGNASIVGPRNLHYVDVLAGACGSFTICVSYSVNGQTPCCKCETAQVTGCQPPPPACCISYVNSTLQSNYVKVKFRTCAPGVVKAKLFRWNGSAYVFLDEDNWPSGYNPAYTYNLEIYSISCYELFCLKICGYTADGTECCTSNFGIQVNCDNYGNYTGVSDIAYPGCNAPGGGGGGGLPLNRQLLTKSTLDISPNPVSNTLLVIFPQKSNINTLQVSDRSGTIVKTINVKGKASVNFSVADLQTGNYYIKPDDPMVESIAFIKQ